MAEPIVLTEDEDKALQAFFRHVYLPYDEARQPLHRLLNRIDRDTRERST
jgi:hypothetical protein